MQKMAGQANLTFAYRMQWTLLPHAAAELVATSVSPACTFCHVPIAVIFSAVSPHKHVTVVAPIGGGVTFTYRMQWTPQGGGGVTFGNRNTQKGKRPDVRTLSKTFT